ncbi:maleylacetoacetate isomerase [Lichenicoccus sp.]|uniref:maleylacetoacetate isomerase n=1 Tax=Lichenicoccus sp. TaxID=2781899 RepID=UPI003D0CE334
MTDQTATGPGLTLYAYWRTSATYRVRVALALKGLTAQERLIDIDAGEHLRPEFLAINPQGALPALVVHGHPPLTQSVAILEFLDELYPQPALLPDDPFGRARVRSLAATMASDTHPLIVPRVRKYLKEAAGFDDAAWRAWQTAWFTRGLTDIEARLRDDPATGTFCHGGTPTMADICLASVEAVARVFKIKVDGIPTVDRIVAACNALDAFSNADPMVQTGAPRA